jgi:hypothetical protein
MVADEPLLSEIDAVHDVRARPGGFIDLLTDSENGKVISTEL